MEKEQIRALLGEADKIAFDQIISGAVLGASNHIKMIGDMFQQIAKDKQRDDDTKKADVLAVSEYFKATRGKSSYAFINAMNIMTGYLNHKGSHIEDLVSYVQNYFHQNQMNCDKIITYAQAEAKSFHTIMIYDYSSTVEKFICSLDSKKDIYIPESRTIDGGKPFIKPLLNAGHRIHYIPDACMMSILPLCDAVFIGAETLYPDGTSFNTAGSDILAVLCKEMKIPYYVLTPLIKIDMRALQGIYKDEISADLKDKLTMNWDDELKATIDCKSIELVGIKPNYITAIITEEGILPPTAIYSVALIYQQKITGGTAL